MIQQGFAFSWTFLICFFTSHFSPNVFSHSWQLNGLNFSWTSWTCCYKLHTCSWKCWLALFVSIQCWLFMNLFYMLLQPTLINKSCLAQFTCKRFQFFHGLMISFPHELIQCVSSVLVCIQIVYHKSSNGIFSSNLLSCFLSFDLALFHHLDEKFHYEPWTDPFVQNFYFSS